MPNFYKNSDFTFFLYEINKYFSHNLNLIVSIKIN